MTVQKEAKEEIEGEHVPEDEKTAEKQSEEENKDWWTASRH